MAKFRVTYMALDSELAEVVEYRAIVNADSIEQALEDWKTVMGKEPEKIEHIQEES